MIVQEPELKSLEKKVVMVDGGFDPLHVGHLIYFEKAKQFGLPVFCNVRFDQYIQQNKKRPELLPESQRIQLIDALQNIDYTYLSEESTMNVLEKLRPAKYLKGKDWEDRGLPVEEVAVCKKYGIEIEYLDTMKESSTDIVSRFKEDLMRFSFEQDVAEFEKMVLSQQPVAPERYDREYFEGGWRDGGNQYTIEKRREIEGRNPQNIKDVFKPERVLDVGCGPGALMLFLQEIGVEVWGLDVSRDAIQAAPEALKGRIVEGSVTEYQDLEKAFDLVICRELLEHLTVLEVRQAVSTLARYTNKYLYVTTRFHPNPNSLLDVTDDFKNDPTHITAMNKELLRTLFVLEGLKSRPDLEAKMDWKNYGRVLVFERNAP